MRCSSRLAFVALLSLFLTSMILSSAFAQQRRALFEVPRVSLASLPEVQEALKFSDELKSQADSLYQKMSDERREVFQNALGDWEGMRKKLEKLYEDTTAKLSEKLDKPQQDRLTQIFVQANGPNAIADKVVEEQLKLTPEQNDKLEAAREANRQAWLGAFQDIQGMSDDERRETFDKLRKESDNRLLQTLTEEQRDQFAKLGGEKLDYDLTPLLPRGR